MCSYKIAFIKKITLNCYGKGGQLGYLIICNVETSLCIFGYVALAENYKF